MEPLRLKEYTGCKDKNNEKIYGNNNLESEDNLRWDVFFGEYQDTSNNNNFAEGWFLAMWRISDEKRYTETMPLTKQISKTLKIIKYDK